MNVDDVVRLAQAAQFAKALNAARRHLGLTQAAFSARLGVSLRTVVRWEHGELLPHAERLDQLFDALDDLPPEMQLDIAVALGGERPPPPPPPPPPRVDPNVAMQMTVYRVADRLDVPASQVRAMLALALVEMDGAGVSVREGMIWTGRSEDRKG